MDALRSLSLLVVMAALACGGPPSRVEPTQPAAPQCSPRDLDGEPLVVDLRADKRADLESALGHGIVAVTYDCGGIRVLGDCTAKGQYGFAGVTEKEERVELSNADEIRANFPTDGAALERERRGRPLDMAIAIVGKRSADRARLGRADFAGTCGGATHWVRSATIGGFALGFASPGKSDLESLFRSADVHDGSLQACRAASVASAAPPDGCSAPIRVVLEPIAAAAAAPLARHCAAGTVLTDEGECRSPNAVPYHLCAPADLADCEAQCTKGSMASCAVAGRSYEIGRGVTADVARAKQLLTRACDGGSAQGCHRLGEIRFFEHAPADALALFQKSCSSGYLDACNSMAEVGLASRATNVDAFTVVKRACAGGSFESCATLGKLYETGLGGAPQNDAEAVKLYELACNSGETRRACVSLSVMVDRGRGTPADPARAVAILRGACDGGSSDACGMLSLHYLQGQGVARDTAKGIELLVKACEGEDRGSCLPLAMRYQAGIGVPKDPDRAKKYFTRACDAGITVACTQAR